MPFNIYICGVGGQGIGMLAAITAGAAMAAGHKVRGCDTHGLAQRHGTVSSHLRLGEGAFTPRVPQAEADLVLALERLEALRAAETMLRPGGTLIYFDSQYQPFSVRSGSAHYPSAAELEDCVRSLGGRLLKAGAGGIADPRMQNAALLGLLAASGALSGAGQAVVEQAMRAALPGAVIEQNIKIFRAAAGKSI